MEIVLYQPTIPPNTGNVARHCVGLDTPLHLVGPIGFDISQKAARRAGLDHWHKLSLTVHPTPENFLDWLGDRTPYLVTKLGEIRYDQVPFKGDDILIFGNELTGLPENWHKRWPQRRVYLPMLGDVRSFNLSNTVAVLLTQALLKSGAFDAHPITPQPKQVSPS